MDNKYNKYQLLMLFFLAVLVLISPLLPSSLRPTYLYFILNLLIIALGAEAGLLSVLCKPPEEKEQHYSSFSVSTKPVMVAQEGSSEANSSNSVVTSASTGNEKKGTGAVEKSASEKISSEGVKMVDNDKLKKCHSMPSLFFIGGGDTEAEEDQVLAEDDYFEAEEEEEEEEEVIAGEVLSEQELYTKAENFIGNFYNQLKMQREESWKKIHGFYQTAY